jgi:hypothetical protein
MLEIFDHPQRLVSSTKQKGHYLPALKLQSSIEGTLPVHTAPQGQQAAEPSGCVSVADWVQQPTSPSAW